MKLEFVNNESKYYDFIRLMRLHPDNIKGFINQNSISEKEQINYMRKYGQFFNICLCDGDPAGFIGVIDDDIRVATNPKYKGMGIGKFMVNEMIKTYPNAIAKIKVDNTTSKKLFESCGFKTDYIIMKK
jgi:RimJ/RimL family protein N-acetyltransferase